MKRIAIATHFLICNFLFLVLAVAAWENGHLLDAITNPVMIGSLAFCVLLFALTMRLTRRVEAP